MVERATGVIARPSAAAPPLPPPAMQCLVRRLYVSTATHAHSVMRYVTEGHQGPARKRGG